MKRLRFYAEYVRDPLSIDVVVYEVVNFQNYDRKSKKPIRDINISDDDENVTAAMSDDSASNDERAARVPWRGQGHYPSRNDSDRPHGQVSRNLYKYKGPAQNAYDHKSDTVKQLKAILLHLEKLGQVGDREATNKTSGACYRCHQMGYLSCECPVAMPTAVVSTPPKTTN